ncbi:hypothetical protein KBB68_02050 [Candidatus Babeliales bacterium]|nr:hypothetical protein [Candidatus Babeliales bacterium]
MQKLFFIMLCITNFACADWKLNAIYNESDLQLGGAYRLKEGGKRKSTYLDKKIKTAQVKPVIMIDYEIVTQAKVQGYLCIIAYDKQSEKYELFFDSQPSHALSWHRMKTTKIGSNQNVTENFDDSLLYARVFLKSSSHEDVQARFSYEDKTELDLIIRGNNGKYSLELSEPAR